MTNWHSHAVLFVCALPVLVIALGLALLVRPGFEPVPRLDVLPKIGGYVVARAIVEGVRK